MIEQTETRIEIHETVDISAQALFALLADPRRHTEIDASGMLRADVHAVPLEAAGQVFTMEMHYPSIGDYRTDNHVVNFVPGHSIAWTTAREGQQPAGVVWSWQLEAEGEDRTRVVHSYDWSGVDDPAILARVSFPRVSAADLQRSVANLAEAARG